MRGNADKDDDAHLGRYHWISKCRQVILRSAYAVCSPYLPHAHPVVFAYPVLSRLFQSLFLALLRRFPPPFLVVVNLYCFPFPALSGPFHSPSPALSRLFRFLSPDLSHTSPLHPPPQPHHHYPINAIQPLTQVEVYAAIFLATSLTLMVQ